VCHGIVEWRVTYRSPLGPSRTVRSVFTNFYTIHRSHCTIVLGCKSISLRKEGIYISVKHDATALSPCAAGRVRVLPGAATPLPFAASRSFLLMRVQNSAPAISEIRYVHL
jgi:hypothetical protein